MCGVITRIPTTSSCLDAALVVTLPGEAVLSEHDGIPDATASAFTFNQAGCMTARRSSLLSTSAARTALTVLLVCAGYYIAGLVGLISRFPASGISTLWPATAVLLVALLLRPPRMWWLYVLALLPVHLHLVWNFQGAVPLPVMLSQFGGNAAYALLVAVVLRRLVDVSARFEDLRSMALFIVVAAIALSWLVSAPTVYLFQLAGWVDDYWLALRGRSLSNGLGTLLATPLVLWGATGGAREAYSASALRKLEFAVVVLGLIAVGIPVLNWYVPGPAFSPLLPLAVLPLLLWVSVRFGPAQLCFALLLVALLALSGAMAGRGPFVGRTPVENTLDLHLFLFATATPLMLLSALVRERGRAMSALRQNEARYRAVVEDQTELICRFLPDGTYTFVNDAYCRYFRRSPEELLGRTFWEFVSPDARDRLRACLASISPQRPVATIEHPVIAPGGEIRWQHWLNRGFFNEQGQILDYQAVGRDITERKLAEESLQAANRELAQLKDRLEAQNTYLQEELTASESVGDIICRSQIMRQMLAQAQRVAAAHTSVLILGETGVGKEVLARTIHRTSTRRDKPFVRLNCATLPAHLIESELFGHERGAFTGAGSQRLGRFEVANGATLFLDEIGELPLDLQAKLLRVLQEGEFERLGSSKTITVDVRLIAATSRHLLECVQQGSFRADLYYRLNVFPISIPPLRMRQDDIVPLATAFLARFGQRVGKVFAPISKAVAELLLHHPWPGNVRELENVIERAVISSPGTILQLPEGWNGQAVTRSESEVNENHRPAAGPGVMSVAIRTSQSPAIPMSIRDLERAHILSTLERTHWRIEGPEGAALVLGMNPSTLRSRMKKLAISRDSVGNSQ